MRPPRAAGWLRGATILFLSALSVTGRGEEVLHVDPDGDDAWSGKLSRPAPGRKDGPLATLRGARDAVRRLKAREALRSPVRVSIHSGTYRLTEPFVLESEDSGTAEAPIAYEGEAGARPILSGGRAITGWRKEGKLWVTEVPEARSSGLRFGALWVNGERRRPARMPNEGYFFTAGKAAPGKDPNTGKEVPRDRTAFRFRPGDIRAFENLPEARVVVYHSWETSILRIASIETETSTVVFTGAAAWPFENWGPRQRYRVENVPEALDAPGEWYLDQRSGVLYCVPREGEDFGRAEVVIPVLKQLVVLAGSPREKRFVEHVRLANLRLLHTEWTAPREGHSDSQAAVSLPGAVEAVGARHVALLRSEVGHVGTYGVWLRAGCQDDLVQENEIHDLGAGGVRIGETASPASDAEAAERNTIDNNFIHDGGTILSGGVGIWIGRSSHNAISHNEVADFDYSGMSVGWSWGFQPSSAHHNVIEYNHVHDVGRGVMNDLGAIYTLGISPGTVERFNLLHDVYAHVFGGWGVYTDEGSTGIVIEKNIVYNTSHGCFHQHYGKENVLQNNVFAFGTEGVLRRSREEDHTSFIFEHNLVLSRGTPLHISSWANGGYRIDSNLYWDYESKEPFFFGMSFADWQAKGRDRRSIVADPLLEDVERFDFRPRSASPAASIGFEPIETREIGLRGDRAWVELPRTVRRVPYRPPGPSPPEPIADGFEETAAGAPARGARTLGEAGSARIRVVEETAAAGRRSLKFTDAAGLDHRFNPHLVYSPGFRAGAVVERFQLRVEPGAVVYHEWRDASSPYHVGPSFRIEADGTILVGGRPAGRAPHGKWFGVEITCGLGKDAAGKWEMELALPGEPGPRRLKDLQSDPLFRELQWLGFVADADGPAVFYLDSLSLRPRG